MAYVFGIEGVPVFEMLVVVSFLLLIGLIFILIELRKMNLLIRKGKEGLRRFERDISEFESDTAKSVGNTLTDYVHNAIARGMSHAQIEASLTKRGWSKQEIDDAFKSAGKK